MNQKITFAHYAQQQELKKFAVERPQWVYCCVVCSGVPVVPVHLRLAQSCAQYTCSVVLAKGFIVV